MDMINEIGRWNYGITGNSELFLWIEAGKILVISDSFCDWNRSSSGCGDADYVR